MPAEVVERRHVRLLAGRGSDWAGAKADERLAAPQEQGDCIAAEVEQVGDLASHLPEHGADVERRDEDAAGLEQRRQPPVLPLAAPVQPRVPDGDRGLFSQAPREVDLPLAEDPFPRGLDEHQDPEWLALDDKG
jgi:hypothetical protein